MGSVRITEIFFSLQGESSHVGKPCAFVRLTGCSLRCVWCDTKYSYAGGREMSQDEVLRQVAAYPTQLVEITGGEPLEQEAVYPLMQEFLTRGYTVMLETGGHVPLDRTPREVIKIIDIKLYSGTPGEPIVFDKPGVAALGCNIHDRMSANIVVVDTPTFARTDDKGQATFDLPAGEHAVKAWHAGQKTQTLQSLRLDVPPAGGPVALTLPE